MDGRHYPLVPAIRNAIPLFPVIGRASLERADAK